MARWDISGGLAIRRVWMTSLLMVTVAMVAADDYDWNIKARYFQVGTSERHEDGVHSIISDLEEPPEGAAEQHAFAEEHGLNHGDVIGFGEYRESFTYIAIRDHTTGMTSFIENPDEAGAGYLTIPEVVFVHVDDGITKYSDVIESQVSMNLHILFHDKFLQDHFGVAIPNTYRFDVMYMWGYLEEFYVTLEGSNVWQYFDLETTSWDDIVAFFKGTTGEQSQLSVRVDLRGEELEEYKEEYRTGDNAYAWLGAAPDLPATWTAKKGGSRMGRDYYQWEWRFSGPKADEDSAREAIDNFLEGFTYSYI